MTEAEIEIVAEELAKLGGTSWYPGRENGSILRIVNKRYRDRAKAAIAALDRFRALKAVTPLREDYDKLSDNRSGMTDAGSSFYDDAIQPGTKVIYRPPGDRRAYPCVVEKVRGDFAYLVPENRSGISWVPLSELLRPMASSGPELK
jgi:hypothetical protein